MGREGWEAEKEGQGRAGPGRAAAKLAWCRRSGLRPHQPRCTWEPCRALKNAWALAPELLSEDPPPPQPCTRATAPHLTPSHLPPCSFHKEENHLSCAALLRCPARLHARPWRSFSKDENYQSAPGSRVGTPAYLAPEVISNVQGQSYDAKVGAQRRTAQRSAAATEACGLGAASCVRRAVAPGQGGHKCC